MCEARKDKKLDYRVWEKSDLYFIILAAHSYVATRSMEIQMVAYCCLS